MAGRLVLDQLIGVRPSVPELSHPAFVCFPFFGAGNATLGTPQVPGGTPLPDGILRGVWCSAPSGRGLASLAQWWSTALVMRRPQDRYLQEARFRGHARVVERDTRKLEVLVPRKGHASSTLAVRTRLGENLDGGTSRAPRQATVILSLALPP